jgi:hypothetical protein
MRNRLVYARDRVRVSRLNETSVNLPGAPIRHSEAVVVLPAAIDSSVTDKGLRRWLARADIVVQDEPQEILPRVLRAISAPATTDGLAALRLWGQTGDRPNAWITAADPVHIEAGLDHLRLHCLWPDEWQDRELRLLFDELQEALADDDTLGFVRVGARGYLRSDTPMPTALLSPANINGRDLRDRLPTDPTATNYHRLLSEIQMILHNSPVNQQRAEQGKRAINSLWIWGGGTASPDQPRDIPPLFADDAVFRGYWYSSRVATHAWPGDLENCTEQSPSGFVAVTPDAAESADEHQETLNRYLRDLRRIMKNSELRQLQLVFRNGLTASIRPRQMMRFWRRNSPFVEQGMTE